MLRDSHKKKDVELRRFRMWQSMRIMRRFTLNDLVVTAGVKYPVALAYVGQLKRQGAVKKVREHTARAGDFAIFTLIGHWGPTPPEILPGVKYG